jgi:hypothetical protein
MRAIVLIAALFMSHLVTSSGSVLGQSRPSPNILKLDQKEIVAKATIDDIAWLQGHWIGEGFGGTVEKFWTPPMGRSMMEAFRLIVDGKVVMHEICTMVEENGSLVYKVKHFDARLKGWEEKDACVDFPLVKLTATGAFFNGLTLQKKDDDTLVTYILIKSKKAGTTREETVTFHRAANSKTASTAKPGH